MNVSSAVYREWEDEKAVFSCCFLNLLHPLTYSLIYLFVHIINIYIEHLLCAIPILRVPKQTRKREGVLC